MKSCNVIKNGDSTALFMVKNIIYDRKNIMIFENNCKKITMMIFLYR